MRALQLRALLFAGFAGALLAFLAACGDGDEKGTLKIEAGPTIVFGLTPFPTVPEITGPLPTRAMDFTAACQKSDQKQWQEMPPIIIDPQRSYTAVIRTEKGDVTLKLFPDVAPITVNNFVFLACKGFYDDLTFHRVMYRPLPPSIPYPFAQAGDPSGRGVMDPVIGGPGYYIPNELSDHRFVKGTVAMSGRGPGTPANGSQFFIVLEDAPEMDGNFAAFGEVLTGFEVLEQLTPRDPQKDNHPGDKILEIIIQEG